MQINAGQIRRGELDHLSRKQLVELCQELLRRLDAKEDKLKRSTETNARLNLELGALRQRIEATCN